MVQFSADRSLDSWHLGATLGPSLGQIRYANVGHVQCHIELFDVSENCSKRGS